MDDNKLTELLVRAYDAAPPHVQDFIDEDGLTEFMLDLQVDMKLHADTSEVVSNQILLTLLGVLDPEELADGLKTKGGLSGEQAKLVLDRVNKLIFEPLGNKTRSESASKPPAGLSNDSLQTSPQTRPTPPPPPAYSAPTPAPVYTAPKPAPVIAQAPTYRPPPAPPTQVLPVTPPAPAIVTPPVQEIQRPLPPPVPEKPTMRTMVSDVEQLKHGDAPVPQTYTPASAPIATNAPVPELTIHAPYTPKQVSPAPAQTTATFTSTPMPRAMQSEPVASVSEPAPVHPLRTPTPTHEEVTHSLKQYGIDPYREVPE